MNSSTLKLVLPNEFFVGDNVFSKLKQCTNSSEITDLIIDQKSRKVDDPAFDPMPPPSPVCLPRTLSKFVNLQTISITCYRIGVVPKCLHNLKELHTLRLHVQGRRYPVISVLKSICVLDKLTELDLSTCRYLKSLPSNIENLQNLVSLNLSGCSRHLSLPLSMMNLRNLTTLNLSKCKFREIPLSVSFLTQLTDLNVDRCFCLKTLPDWIGKLSNLTNLSSQRCPYFISLPESIGNLSKLTSLDLSECRNLKSLPESIGNLSNLTSLNLDGCDNLQSFPTSIFNLTHLTTTFRFMSIFPIPSDIEWTQFKRNIITLPTYVEYMMRNNRSSSILDRVVRYMKILGVESFEDECNRRIREIQSSLYELIKRRREGGGDMIRQICSMLTNDGMNKLKEMEMMEPMNKMNNKIMTRKSKKKKQKKKENTKSGYGERIVEWEREEMKETGLWILKILYSIMNESSMKEMWLDGGKEGFDINEKYEMMIDREEEEEEAAEELDEVEEDYDEFEAEEKNEKHSTLPDSSDTESSMSNVMDVEIKRERERKWKDGRDIMSEEDVMETCIMHLCIPDYKKKEKEKEKDSLIVPSECSLDALSIFLNEESSRNLPYHFPVYDLTRQPTNFLVFRNLPSSYYDSFKDTLQPLILSSCDASSFIQLDSSFRIISLILPTSQDAVFVVARMNGYELPPTGQTLSVSQGSAFTLSFQFTFPLINNLETQSQSAFGFSWYVSIYSIFPHNIPFSSLHYLIFARSLVCTKRRTQKPSYKVELKCSVCVASSLLFFLSFFLSSPLLSPLLSSHLISIPLFQPLDDQTDISQSQSFHLSFRLYTTSPMQNGTKYLSVEDIFELGKKMGWEGINLVLSSRQSQDIILISLSLNKL